MSVEQTRDDNEIIVGFGASDAEIALLPPVGSRVRIVGRSVTELAVPDGEEPLDGKYWVELILALGEATK